jgi:hypothetical protein
MNKLQQFIQSHSFLRDTDLPALIALDRLCQVLVRCGGCRFTCAAQDVAHLVKCVSAGGDYVRDVSFPVGSFERAASWQPEPTYTDAWTRAAQQQPKFVRIEEKRINPKTGRIEYPGIFFDESQCGGAFDGNTVTSDADPGL